MKKRTLSFDLSSSDEEDSSIPIEVVNKIIYDYVQQIGYETTGKALLDEHPIEVTSKVKHAITNFMSRVQALQKKFDSNQDDNEPAKKKLKLVKSTEVSTQTEPSFYSLARLKSLLPPLKNKPRPVDNSKIKITLDNDELRKSVESFMEEHKIQNGDKNRQEYCEDSYVDIDGTTVQNGDKREPSCSRIQTKIPKREPLNDEIKSGQKLLETIKPPTIIQDPTQELIEGKIATMERFLKVKPIDKDIMMRIKTLEDKILELEEKGVFSPLSAANGLKSAMIKQEEEDREREELDSKLKELQNALRKKQLERNQKGKQKS